MSNMGTEGIFPGEVPSQASDQQPAISVSDLTPSDAIAARLMQAFNHALAAEFPHPAEFLTIDGMSGRRYRLLINELIRLTESPRYLEIGVWAGSTLCSAVAGNKLSSVAIDNWSQFGGPRTAFFNNLERFRSNTTNIEVIEADFRSVDYSQIGPFNIYLFDGPHKARDHKDALSVPLPALDPCFVFIVDDWNLDAVREGTKAGIAHAGLKVNFWISVRTTVDGTLSPVRGKKSNWHNGYMIALLQKSQAD